MKESKEEPNQVGEKPDFFEVVKGKFIHSGKAAHSRIPIQSVNEREARAYVAGCNYVWDTYISGKLTPIEPLKKEKMIDLESSPVETPVRSAEAFLKEVAIKFFYWWYNTKGNNTEQGFDDWIQEDGKKYIDQLAQFKPSVVGEKDREHIAQILRDNITFSGQVGDYVIHGAIDKIIQWANSRVGEKEEQRFTIEDMRNAFEAGERHEFMKHFGALEKLKQSCFDEWIKTRKQ